LLIPALEQELKAGIAIGVKGQEGTDGRFSDRFIETVDNNNACTFDEIGYPAYGVLIRECR